ncbi:hypothetical protein BWD42_07370 [Sphingobacterium sp. CZ-UAM]|uniref:SusC/RagA family TonB-linked outer membrane protein n=1 Tax=Sphingobacterium sp. CZ-UAM TaxID=1933868 RepID=UPI0009871BBD|nr:SusC/RagA family TonB-linked outer membrane protein [Sphingobacterium sp. CZ-UAM]OOG19714.1 hypothetical protein BWD42_07370 [Sphingobacterium sp. CZ-UAM]
MKFKKNRTLYYLLLLGGLTISTLGWAQQSVSIKLKKANRSFALQHVKKQVNMQFLYNEDDLNSYPPIDLNLQGKPLTVVLDQILKDTELAYRINDNLVTISLRKNNSSPSQQEELLIKGKVFDQQGTPLGGVNVIELSTRRAIYTSNTGEYQIKVPKKDAVIKVSFIGKRYQIWPVNKTDNPHVLEKNFVLIPEDNQINEVVVTGYQNISQRDMVGASSSVKMDDIKIAGINQVDKLLQGRLPGVMLVNTSGLVGAKPRLRVRGTSTLLGNQEPVWVVDGIIQEDRIPFDYKQLNSITPGSSMDAIKNMIGSAVSFLNVDDIDNITVLKDAASTAIYGVKAANGVIVINTKKGKIGDAIVNYNTNWTLSQRPNYGQFRLMNSKQRIDVSRQIYQDNLKFSRFPDRVSYEGLLQDLFNKKITQDEFVTKVAHLETVNTDWFDLLFQTPLSQTHNLSLSGGTEKVRYYSSVGYLYDKGNTIGNEQKRYSAALNISSQWKKNVNLGFKVNAGSDNTKAFYQIDPFNYAFNTSRSIPAFTEQGDYYFYTVNGYNYNILNERDQTGNNNKNNTVALVANVDYKFLKFFNFQSIFSYGLNQTTGESYATERSNSITTRRYYEYGTVMPGTAEYKAATLPHGGELNGMRMNNHNLTWRNSLLFNHRFRENKDDLNVMLGQEIRSTAYEGISQTNYGYLPARGKTFTMPPTTTHNSFGTRSPNTIYDGIVPSITDRLSNFVSYFGTATYNFQQKYIFNTNIRLDASNRFGQYTNHRFLPIWSAGFKWNIAEEKVFDQLTWLDQFSTRLSYGFQGNVAENFGPDLILQIVRTDSDTGESMLTVRSLAYPDLRWERNKTVNMGLDFAFFKNRLSGTFEYYHKKGLDIIIEKDIPLEYGLRRMPINGGDIRNDGWELALNLGLIRKSNLGWDLGFNTARAWSSINRSSSAIANQWQSAISGGGYKEGFPVSGIFSFAFAGLNPKNGIPLFPAMDPVKNPAVLSDITKALVYSGQLDPKFTAGISNQIRYGNFSLGAFFYLSTGSIKRLPPLFDLNIAVNSAPDAGKNLPLDLINRWQKPGDEIMTNIPSLPNAEEVREDYIIGLPNFNNQGSPGYAARGMYDYSTARVISNNFIRLKNLDLAYTLPKKITQHWGIKSCRIMASATNLFYIANKGLQGQDPEVDGNNLPINKTYSFSLNIGF